MSVLTAPFAAALLLPRMDQRSAGASEAMDVGTGTAVTRIVSVF